MSTSQTAPDGSKPKRGRRNTVLKRIINRRRAVQAALGVATWLIVTRYGISLWWVFAVAVGSGVLLGKYFCRWVCPMGAIMEIMLGAGGEESKQKSLYSYFKIGCPISWAGGVLNKLSILRVKVDESKCTHCKVCDKACYVAQLSEGRSLHQAGAINASTHYSCSRCLGCVKACPTGALSVGPSWPFGTLVPATGLIREPAQDTPQPPVVLTAELAAVPPTPELGRPRSKRRARRR